MSQAALDEQLSPSVCIPSIDDELATYTRLSAQAREHARDRLRKGLAYADGADTKLDLLLPKADGPVPVLIYIHGGFWQQLGRADSAFGARGLNAAGAAWAAVGYTLAPQASLADIVAQVRAAVAWLYREASTLGLDRSRFVLAGSSAGAHLVALLLQTDWPSYGLPADAMAGGCLVSGVFDLEAVRQSYVNEPLGLSDEAVATLSPLRHVAASIVPVAIVHGDNETQEFKRESRLYAEALTRAGQTTPVHQICGRNHFDVVLDLGDPATFLGHTARGFLGLNAIK